jgi:hypothetical protein
VTRRRSARPPTTPDTTQLRLDVDVPYRFRRGDLVRVEGLRGRFRFMSARSDRGGPVADVYGPLPGESGGAKAAAKVRSVHPERIHT